MRKTALMAQEVPLVPIPLPARQDCPREHLYNGINIFRPQTVLSVKARLRLKSRGELGTPSIPEFLPTDTLPDAYFLAWVPDYVLDILCM